MAPSSTPSRTNGISKTCSKIFPYRSSSTKTLRNSAPPTKPSASSKNRRLPTCADQHKGVHPEQSNELFFRLPGLGDLRSAFLETRLSFPSSKIFSLLLSSHAMAHRHPR